MKYNILLFGLSMFILGVICTMVINRDDENVYYVVGDHLLKIEDGKIKEIWTAPESQLFPMIEVAPTIDIYK